MARYSHVTQNIDTSTGELTSIQKTFTVKSKSSEEFFITFLSGLNAICELSRPSDIKVLAALCTKAEFNTGVVQLTSKLRKELIEKLSISDQAFSNSISRLRETKLISGSRGDYEINPHCFWKGTTDERSKLLRDKSADILLKFRTYDSKSQI